MFEWKAKSPRARKSEQLQDKQSDSSDAGNHQKPGGTHLESPQVDISLTMEATS